MIRDGLKARLPLEKLALLGLFIAVLLAAQVMVSVRSGIIMSEPVALIHTGMSASVPAGNGWESEGQWRHQDDCFVLKSSFASLSSRPTAWAQCKYMLASEDMRAEQIFEARASEIEGQVVERGRIATAVLNIDYARLEKAGTPLTIFYGTGVLPDNRRLSLEVNEIGGEVAFAESAFRRIAGAVVFEATDLLGAGAEVVARMRNAGLASYLDGKSEQSGFLIKDSRDTAAGFTLNVMVDIRGGSGDDIEASSYFYLRGPREQVTMFRGDDDFSTFKWQSETVRGTNATRVEIRRLDTGLTSIWKSTDAPEPREYVLSAAAIPRILFGQLLEEMLESGVSRAVFDIIEASGIINPTLISRVDGGGDVSRTEGGYVLRVEPLNERGLAEDVQLDGSGRVSSRKMEQQKGYTFERASVERIAGEFPEQADRVLRRDLLLRPERRR